MSTVETSTPTPITTGPTGALLSLTDKAVEKVKYFAGTMPEAAGKPLRIFIQGGGCSGFQYGFRAVVVHEGLRLLRRRDQVGRQDSPRREDGHPQHRPPGHRGIHPLQVERREESLGADRRRLRRLV